MSQRFGFERLVEICACTHDKARQSATRAIDRWLVVRNWLFGWYIVEYEQEGADRAEYGSQTLSRLSAALKGRIGRGVSVHALEKIRRFYLAYQHILPDVSAARNSATPSRISGDGAISATASRIFIGLSSRTPPPLAEWVEQSPLQDLEGNRMSQGKMAQLRTDFELIWLTRVSSLTNLIPN